MPPLDSAETPTDRELLAAYTNTGDVSAFEQLLNRHGPMVMSVCRRILRDAADADDAFQATFLALVENARAIRRAQSLAGWLYRIAYRTAVRIQTTTQHRLRKLEMLAREISANYDGGDAELLAELGAAIEALPESERAAIVLCDIEGQRHREVAQQLGVPISTISNRVNRARARLRRHLQSQGLVVSGAVIGSTLGQLACPETASAAVVNLTLQGAVQVREAGLAACSGPSAKAASYAKSVVATLWNPKYVALALVTCAAVSAVLWLVVTIPVPSSREAAEPSLAPRKVISIDSSSPLWSSPVPVTSFKPGNGKPPRGLSVLPIRPDELRFR